MTVSNPVPRHLCDPRRAYDEDGREICPPTIEEGRAEGERTAAVFCTPCGHSGIVSTDRFSDVLCSKCGSKDVQIQIDIAAHYRRLKEKFGFDLMM